LGFVVVKRTIYCTPAITTLCRYLAHFFMRLRGWKVVGDAPVHKKYVLIAAPHTSNYDFPLMLGSTLILKMNLHWMGKASLFSFPTGALARWLGGIAINRSTSNNTVEATVKVFDDAEELVIVIPPEGTRAAVTEWKTGFYHIAYQAKVPIVLGYVDTVSKTSGFGNSFIPTGDFDKDMIEIRAFYQDKRGFD
jgi:1-acyl-sn-glycerol-3-phosphate acyltransferase